VRFIWWTVYHNSTLRARVFLEHEIRRICRLVRGASAFFIRAYFETTETTCKNNFFFSPRNYAAFLNRRAVARRKGKLFQTSCFPSLEDVVVNYTDAPELHARREKYSPPANIFDIIKEK